MLLSCLPDAELPRYVKSIQESMDRLRADTAPNTASQLYTDPAEKNSTQTSSGSKDIPQDRGLVSVKVFAMKRKCFFTKHFNAIIMCKYINVKTYICCVTSVSNTLHPPISLSKRSSMSTHISSQIVYLTISRTLLIISAVDGSQLFGCQVVRREPSKCWHLQSSDKQWNFRFRDSRFCGSSKTSKEHAMRASEELVAHLQSLSKLTAPELCQMAVDAG